MDGSGYRKGDEHGDDAGGLAAWRQAEGSDEAARRLRDAEAEHLVPPLAPEAREAFVEDRGGEWAPVRWVEGRLVERRSCEGLREDGEDEWGEREDERQRAHDAG